LIIRAFYRDVFGEIITKEAVKEVLDGYSKFFKGQKITVENLEKLPTVMENREATVLSPSSKEENRLKYNKMTKPELKVILKDLKIKFGSKFKKSQLVELILENI